MKPGQSRVLAVTERMHISLHPSPESLKGKEIVKTPKWTILRSAVYELLGRIGNGEAGLKTPAKVLAGRPQAALPSSPRSIQRIR